MYNEKETVSTYVDKATYELLLKYANKMKWRKAQAVREIVTEFLAKQK